MKRKERKETKNDNRYNNNFESRKTTKKKRIKREQLRIPWGGDGADEDEGAGAVLGLGDAGGAGGVGGAGFAGIGWDAHEGEGAGGAGAVVDGVAAVETWPAWLVGEGEDCSSLGHKSATGLLGCVGSGRRLPA